MSYATYADLREWAKNKYAGALKARRRILEEALESDRPLSWDQGTRLADADAMLETYEIRAWADLEDGDVDNWDDTLSDKDIARLQRCLFVAISEATSTSTDEWSNSSRRKQADYMRQFVEFALGDTFYIR